MPVERAWTVELCGALLAHELAVSPHLMMILVHAVTHLVCHLFQTNLAGKRCKLNMRL